MSLTKLHFEVFGNPGYAFDADFNPTEYTLAKENDVWSRKRHSQKPLQQYVGVGNEDLTLDLLFDTTREGLGRDAVAVTTRTERVDRLMRVDRHTHAVPQFQVTWGTGLKLRAVATRLRQRFTLFNADGVPLRAEVTLTMREVGAENSEKAKKTASPDRTKTWVVRRGETMTTIASHAYDDARHWRVIAEHNPRVDPRRPAPGTVLELPPLPSTEGAAR
ncbi:CIS tube protein [Saccharothrix syringae]|uniref:Peptidoglycan-binding protein n=1 Tax=Saccharothrix syringae TaxID=103733 RepID=A0A5Q0GYR9_SACSY|nr:phage tail protein [Saccharothrix syringae]QFZ18654.1 peptidoglycan-binding protein [Saccharothrix syringae]